jgi:hypothetical protein
LQFGFQVSGFDVRKCAYEIRKTTFKSILELLLVLVPELLCEHVGDALVDCGGRKILMMNSGHQKENTKGRQGEACQRLVCSDGSALLERCAVVL